MLFSIPPRLVFAQTSSPQGRREEIEKLKYRIVLLYDSILHSVELLAMNIDEKTLDQ